MSTDRPEAQQQGDGVEAQGVPEGAEAAEAIAEPAGGASAELEAAKDRYLRLAAEYDNYRRRTERERTESFVRAQAQLVERLLEPLDDLQRVADFAADSTTVTALLEGVQMVERKLLRVLEGAGLEVMDAEGHPFDPSRHEAITTVAAETAEEDDTVADVFQKGYQFKDVMLRPARVRVRKHQG